MPKHIQPGNEPLDPDNVPTYGQWTLVNSKLTTLKSLMTTGSSLITAVRNLLLNSTYGLAALKALLDTMDLKLDGQTPNLRVLDEDVEVYASGIAKTELFAWVNTGIVKQVVGTLYLYNFTAAKIMTITIEELDGGLYRIIDSKAYTIGTDPNPHFEFFSSRSFKIYATLNITEGVNRNIPKTITILNYEM